MKARQDQRSGALIAPRDARSELHPARLFELILGTLFSSRSYQVYSTKMAKNDYEPGFKATPGLKDLRLAREAASGTGRTLPMLDAVHGRMRETVDAGFGDRD